jgi:predicted short-subunit dehydrogenase-like oxidoreductase (DUF2520 family)
MVRNSLPQSRKARRNRKISVGKKSIAIIGAGAVGGAIAAAVHKRLYNVGALFTKHRHHSNRLPSGIRSIYSGADCAKLPDETQVVLVAVADDEICHVVEKLDSAAGFSWRSVVVLHTSGALSSDVFSPLRKRGAICGSLHPLQSFPRTLPVKKRKELLFDIYWGVEGEKEAVREAKRIVSFFRGRVLMLHPDTKALYHAACVCVSNYVATLLGMAEEIGVKSGIERKVFLQSVGPLIMTSMKNVLARSPAKALTGPIERGDERTVRRHIEDLRRLVPNLLDTYAALGAETVALALKKGTLKKEIAANLYRLFYTL